MKNPNVEICCVIESRMNEPYKGAPNLSRHDPKYCSLIGII